MKYVDKLIDIIDEITDEIWEDEFELKNLLEKNGIPYTREAIHLILRIKFVKSVIDSLLVRNNYNIVSRLFEKKGYKLIKIEK